VKLYSINNLVARKILAAVKPLLRSKKDDNDFVMVQPYVNCREQGFALCSNNNRKVAFSEYRRSDEIVVYYGKRKDFAFNTNIPSDKVYENAKFYAPKQIESAARFVVNCLKS